MTRRQSFAALWEYLLFFLKWCALGVAVGCIGGLLGAGFHHTLHFVTGVRGQHRWLVWLLPLGGLAAVGLYRLLRMRNNRGTNEIIDAVVHRRPIAPQVAPAIFLSTAITHLFGGSAGREGAALQLGGSVASSLGRLLRLKEDDLRGLTMSGMSAVFAGLFGTPLTACLFVLEFETVGTVFTPALLPCFLAALTAGKLSSLLGVHPEGLLLDHAATLGLGTIWKYALLAVLVSVLGIAMCYILHKAEHAAHKWIPNDFLRIAAGGAVLAVLTALVGDHRFNGAGMDMALEAVAGNADWYAFLLKLLFTAVTLAAGFKGGEIVPTFCIGATFGCVAGSLLGLDPGIAAALGLVGLFCSVTNSPLAAIVLSIEMFGAANLYLFCLTCVICFILSGRSSLYASQILRFRKSRMTENNPDILPTETPHSH